MNPILAQLVPFVKAQIEEVMKQTIEDSQSVTQSIFNLNMNEVSAGNVEVPNMDMNAQPQQWIDFMIGEHKKREEIIKDYEASRQANPEEQQLDPGSDIQDLIERHLDFRNSFNAFLVQYKQLKQLQIHMLELCQHILELVFEVVLEENLAPEAANKKPSQRG